MDIQSQVCREEVKKNPDGTYSSVCPFCGAASQSEVFYDTMLRRWRPGFVERQFCEHASHMLNGTEMLFMNPLRAVHEKDVPKLLGRLTIVQ